jgi:predicted AlkP superfamily phosphohydrolase/phosphomutase
MRKRRVLAICLDGFTWRLGRQFMTEGVMPCLAQLVENGCHGDLQSVIPAETAPAWSSFQTGCLPAKTNVFAFHAYDRSAKRIRLNSYSDIAVATLWEVVGHAKKKVVSLNLPVTSPPPAVDGVIIPGLLCPNLSKTTVHPEWAYAKYIKSHPDYAIVNDTICEKVYEFAERCAATERTRSEVALELMQDIDWDIFCFQIQSGDLLQHRLWWALDPTADGFSEAEHSKVCTFYRSCDDIIAKLTAAAGEDTLTIILSDHGFCKCAGGVHVNTWLRKNGYLCLPERRKTRWDEIKDNVGPLKTAARTAGNCVRSSRNLVRRSMAALGIRKKQRPFSEIELRHLRQLVDIETTTAFCLGGAAGMLYVNAAGDRRAELCRSLADELLRDFGPQSSHPAIERIVPAADVYGPADASAMPDLVLEWCAGYTQVISPQGNEIVTPHEPNVRQTGTHEKDGIVVLHGPGVKKGSLLNAAIIDAAPTILAYLGIAVPRHMDGKVLQGAFVEPLKTDYADIGRTGGAATSYTNEEQEAVERNLKDLGYL